jgi:DNA primase
MLNFYDLEKEIEFKDGENISKEIYNKTSEYLKEEQDRIFSKVCSDINSWMHERFSNVYNVMFDYVVNYLLGNPVAHVPQNVKELLAEKLNGLGLKEQKFREKIFEENKETIIHAIKNDSVYELVSNMYTRYFHAWNYKDISTAYPQSEVIKAFFQLLIDADVEGFKSYIGKNLDDEILSKKKYLEELKKEIQSINQQIEELQ